MKNNLANSKDSEEEAPAIKGAFQPVSARAAAKTTNSENVEKGLRRSTRASKRSASKKRNKRSTSFQNSESVERSRISDTDQDMDDSETLNNDSHPLK